MQINFCRNSQNLELNLLKSLIHFTFKSFSMKKITTLSSILGFAILTLGFFSCEKSGDVDPGLSIQFVDHYYTDAEYGILSQDLELPELPDNYIGFGNSFVRNAPPTLGRVLFYDKNLSKDRSVSCASCHKQELAFSDDEAFSRGIEGNQTDRNSLSLASFSNFQEYYSSALFSSTKFFWDERVETLHEQMMQTIPNNKEMGMDLAEMVERIKEKEYYQILYDKAFQEKEITVDNVLIAIESFVNSITSRQSKFDGGWNGFDSSRDFPNFTAAENIGKNLFRNNCASCHAFSIAPAFGSEFSNSKTVANNGLDLEYTDKGVGEFTEDPTDYGKFKIPGMRNIALTGPYMHDGRFSTLEEVVDFYNDGMADHPNLDEEFRNLDGSVKKLGLTDDEKSALVAFLHTLTDPSVLEDVKWSNPFK